MYLGALGNEGYFYRKPLEADGDKLRYGKQPVGVNKLDMFMKDICKKGNLSGNFTNHSGKRTCATQLYRAGIEEQEIMGRTGHRSTAVRSYKTASDQMQKTVSKVLNPPSEEKTLPLESTSHSQQDENHLDNMKSPKTKRQKSDTDGMRCLSDITNTKGVFNFSNCNFSFN